MKYCTGERDYRIAREVAISAGLPDPGEHRHDTPYHVQDGEEIECEGCCKPIRPGGDAYWKDGPPEYPGDGSWYGSIACREDRWLAPPGTYTWFLERMGWQLEPERGVSGPWVWVLREPDPDDECDPGKIIARGDVGAKQGPGPTFRKHLAMARRLERKFKKLAKEAPNG